jgi:hypothetical protein
MSQIRQVIPVTLRSAKDNVSSRGIQPGKYYLVDEQIWWSGMANPLNARAWVMQERLLSPRILHFTQERMPRRTHSAGNMADGLPAPPKPDVSLNAACLPSS